MIRINTQRASYSKKADLCRMFHFQLAPILSICLLLLPACDQKILSEQQLAQTIAGVYLTESILKQQQIPLDSPEAAAYYEQTFAKHNTTQWQYEQSIIYYTNKKPKELGNIFENATKHLETIIKGIEKDSIGSLYTEPKVAEPADTLETIVGFSSELNML